ncbi:MAG: HIT family protein [Sinobacteraceae bacterium]|nr:HIT family protein [Nevskiaceae bacterium]
MNETIRKFGYPDTLIAEREHWLLLLRPKQATLGALILAAKGSETRFADLSAAAFAEFGTMVKAIETAAGKAFAYDRINYLMLMMVDPQVHFHVLPRYAGPRRFEGVQFADSGWPGPPNLAETTPTDAALNRRLIGAMRAAWPDRS